VQDSEFARPLKRSSGIPNSFMKVVEDVNQPGVMWTGSGQLAVPTIDAYVLSVQMIKISHKSGFITVPNCDDDNNNISFLFITGLLFLSCLKFD